MDSKEIRNSFVNFFESKGHLHMPGSSLIPKDPTLLFTSAGMVPLKSYFLGEETPPSARITTVQKCLRTNDIENVGYTARHHTFFEMLGNFSIGDYFKEDAIAWAVEFVTKILGLPFERLWVTIYKQDVETKDIWKKFGMPDYKVIPLGEEDNFWTMGPVGPCGPCSEIYFDRGVRNPGEEKELPGSSGERFLEFWNLVFTQFDRQPDGTLKPLARKNIDTGMGLERTTSILENTLTDFETELFLPLINKIENMSNKNYGEDSVKDRAFRAIADHIRAVSFLISEGLLPGNEKRAYVLRRLIRRSALFGRALGFKEPFLYEMIPSFVGLMGGIYPELATNEEKISTTVKTEEQRFSSVLEDGFSYFENKVNELKAKESSEKSIKEFPSRDVFYLYDTLGFPVELSEVLIKEYGLYFNKSQFNELMEEQRNKARFAFAGANLYTERVNLLGVKKEIGETEFIGYSSLTAESTVKAILKGEKALSSAQKGDKISIVLDVTPFYAEKGGQIGDSGVIENEDFVFIVEDTKSPVEGLIIHYGYVDKGTAEAEDRVIARVNSKRRHAIMRAHTSTHILQAGLRRVFGEGISQQGSQVSPDEFRFDFNFAEAFPREKILEIESFVNDVIFQGIPVETQIMRLDEAKANGALAFFEEKYGDTVRVVKIDDISKELCGGTHVSNTNDIGVVVLSGVRAVSSGIKRIEGFSGLKAFQFLQEKRQLLKDVSDILGTQEESIIDKSKELVQGLKEYKGSLERTRLKLFEMAISNLKPIIFINKELQIIPVPESFSPDVKSSESFSQEGVPVYAEEFEGAFPDELRKAFDIAKKKLNSGVIIFVSKTVNVESVLIGRLSEDAPPAINLFKKISLLLNIKGGGSERLAQGSTNERYSIEEILRALR